MVKILFVDDQTIYLMDILRRLKDYDVVSVKNLDDANKAFFENDKEPFNIIIMDGCLDSRDTPDTLELTKSIIESGYEGILIANSSMPEINESLIEYGATHINKSKLNVHRLVKELLSEKDK